MIKRLRGLLVMLCCVAGMAVAEEKNILVTSGSDRATPIAVVPFALQGGSVLPEDIAEAVYFLASDKSGKSTGNILNVDAGNLAAFTR